MLGNERVIPLGGLLALLQGLRRGVNVMQTLMMNYSRFIIIVN